jgi:hypothetical protein
MGIDEIWEIHSRSKEKVNCIYHRKGGAIGYWYIDPSKPLRRSYSGNNYGYAVIDKNDLIRCSLVDGFRVGVFKQDSKVEIFVKPSDLWIHKGKVQQVVKVLYGKD